MFRSLCVADTVVAIGGLFDVRVKHSNYSSAVLQIEPRQILIKLYKIYDSMLLLV